MSEPIEVVRRGPIAEIWLNRPDRRNAMSAAMGTAISGAVADLNDDDDLRVVVVRGRGKSFSAGGDLDMLEARTRTPSEFNRVEMRRFYRKFLSLRDLHVPTIAAIHGHAIGAGMCFALGCDLRIAAEGTKLGLTFVKVGIHPGMGATFLLPRVVGHAKAAELLLTGRVILADEALACGLVSRVVPADDLGDAANALAEEIAAVAPIAARQLAQTLRAGDPRSLERTLEREAACQAVDYTTEDMLEAVTAIREKRKPVFHAR